MPDSVVDDAVREEIARRAYELYCDRGCVHGGDLEDWLAAERELLARQGTPSRTEAIAAPDSPRRRGPRNHRVPGTVERG